MMFLASMGLGISIQAVADGTGESPSWTDIMACAEQCEQDRGCFDGPQDPVRVGAKICHDQCRFDCYVAIVFPEDEDDD